MLASGIGPKSAHGVAADRVRGDHALNGKLHGELRLRLHQGVIAHGLQVADVAGMTVIVLFLLLAAGEDGILAVDDDDMVTAVNMGSKGGLMLAAKQYRGLRRYMIIAQVFRGVNNFLPVF